MEGNRHLPHSAGVQGAEHGKPLTGWERERQYQEGNVLGNPGGALSTCRVPLLHGKVAAWVHRPPPPNIRITGFLSKSSATRCGCTFASASASAMWKKYCWNAA